MATATTADVIVDDQGSVVAFQPLTEAGREWFSENVPTEPWQWMADRLCVDRRYAGALMDGMFGDGLDVQ